jgi:hypothetical protein
LFVSFPVSVVVEELVNDGQNNKRISVRFYGRVQLHVTRMLFGRIFAAFYFFCK